MSTGMAGAGSQMDSLLGAMRALMAVPAPQLKEVRTALFRVRRVRQRAGHYAAEAGGSGRYGIQRRGAVKP